MVGFAAPSGCFANRRIVEGGAPVGRMYRDDEWVFLVGDEDQAVMDDPASTVLVALEWMQQTHPSITPFLTLPEGSDLVWTAGGVVDADTGRPARPASGPVRHPGFPVVSGDIEVGGGWWITLPGPMNRRVEADDLVMWRPGLTVRCAIYSVPDDGGLPGRAASARQLVGVTDPTVALVERVDGGVALVAGRVHAGGGDSPAVDLGAAVGPGGALVVMVQSDDDVDADVARDIVASPALRRR